MLRILLADDHDLTRAGLRYLLEKHEGWTVCAEAANGRLAVELALQQKPDVAILDMSMPSLSGTEATREILEKLPRTKILIYTMHETEAVIGEAVDAGASGIILKSDAGENMVAAVESVISGHRFFTPHVAERVVEAYLTRKTRMVDVSGDGNSLTPREREVIRLLSEGMSNKEVAGRLSISTRTAEGHRTDIMKRLKLGSLAELVRYAVRNGLVEP